MAVFPILRRSPAWPAAHSSLAANLSAGGGKNKLALGRTPIETREIARILAAVDDRGGYNCTARASA